MSFISSCSFCALNKLPFCLCIAIPSSIYIFLSSVKLKFLSFSIVYAGLLFLLVGINEVFIEICWMPPPFLLNESLFLPNFSILLPIEFPNDPPLVTKPFLLLCAPINCFIFFFLISSFFDYLSWNLLFFSSSFYYSINFLSSFLYYDFSTN